MQVFRGTHHAALNQPCALTIGNFDGVHRGHQAMLSLLHQEAQQRGLPSTVMTFEPHPRDFFAKTLNQSQGMTTRIALLRNKVEALACAGIQRLVILPFNRALAALSPEAFTEQILVRGLNAQYILIGDDFRFGAKRAGDFAFLQAASQTHGFDLARMGSFEVHGERVSSSLVRKTLQLGDMSLAANLLGHPYTISGHVIHGQKLGRSLNCRTLNVRFRHAHPAATGIFVSRVHGLTHAPLDSVASLGFRPTVEDKGRVLLEVHCFDWPAHLGQEGGYGKIIRVELLHKLRDEIRYDGLEQLQAAIAQDMTNAQSYFQT